MNISNPGPVDTWQEVLPQHNSDQLVSATAVKARAPALLFVCLYSIALFCLALLPMALVSQQSLRFYKSGPQP